jgi:hypothetical protein
MFFVAVKSWTSWWGGKEASSIIKERIDERFVAMRAAKMRSL